MKRKEPLILIEILNWNGTEITRDCINSILQNTNYKNYKIIVIDNGSTDRSVKKIKSTFKEKVLIHRFKQNLGFGKAYNEANKVLIKKFNPEYILLLNNDIIVPNDQKDWLSRLVKTAEDDKSICLVGCKLVNKDGSIQHTGTYITKGRLQQVSTTKKDDVVVSSNIDEGSLISVLGAVMLIPSKCWKKIGGFDPDFYPYDGEDTDLGLRFIEAGMKIAYNGKVTLVHFGGASRPYNLKMYIISARNKTKLYIKHKEIRKEVIYLLISGFKKEKKKECIIKKSVGTIIGIGLGTLWYISKVLKI